MEEKILYMYFEEKNKQKDIANKLNVSKYKVSRTLTKDPRYIQEKEKRKKSNHEKNVKETKEYIKANREIVKLNNNLEYLSLKRLLNQDSIELSKGKRLSNMAYRNWNTSAFTYNDKKSRYEFRKELGRSFDVPKYIKVEV